MRTSRDATTSKTTEHEDIEHPSNQYESTERESRPPVPFEGRRIKAAVIGTGSIASGSHLPALAALAAEGEVEIVAAVDIDAEAVKRFCADGGVPHGYTDLDRMLAEQRPDLVSICTPPTLHRDQTVAALRAGACVVREAARADPRRLRRRGDGGGDRERSVRLHRLPAPVRLGRPARTASHRRRSHGAALVAHCQTTWYRNAAYYAVPWRGKWETEGGGPAMGHGIHQMDLLLDLLGPWSEVRAMAGRLVHDVQTEDVSTALVRFESGALATVVNSVLSPDEVSRIRIDCEHATVELTHLYGHSNENWRITPAPDAPVEDVAAWQDFGADVPSSHLAQLRDLVASMRAGERPRSSGADGRTSLELITALYKSAFTDVTVRAGEIGPGDPYYTALHGGAPGWAPTTHEEASA